MSAFIFIWVLLKKTEMRRVCLLDINSGDILVTWLKELDRRSVHFLFLDQLVYQALLKTILHSVILSLPPSRPSPSSFYSTFSFSYYLYEEVERAREREGEREFICL